VQTLASWFVSWLADRLRALTKQTSYSPRDNRHSTIFEETRVESMYVDYSRTKEASWTWLILLLW